MQGRGELEMRLPPCELELTRWRCHLLNTGRTGLEIMLVLGYPCQTRDAFEICLEDTSSRQLNI